MTIPGGEEGLVGQPLFSGRRAQMFPQLTPLQIARLEAHGVHRRIAKGEILAQPGDRNLPLLVVLSGTIEVVQSGLAGKCWWWCTRPAASPAR